MKRIGSRTVYEGRIVAVRLERFLLADGTSVEREVVGHPGAVAVVAHDAETLFLVRQPREAVAADGLLELPAGKLDVEGESPLQCAKRELAEETGMAAADWRFLKRVYTSPGFATEVVHIFVATELEALKDAQSPPEERIEVVRVPLSRLSAVIEECTDAKSLVGLLLFSSQLG
jgi:8-oxo-dGTP pyrophosphatase MutT (NUDIX family)